MLKTFRELQRLAEREGMTKVRIEGGTPHGRLTGLLEGREVSMPVSANRRNPRGAHFMRMNIRHKRREMEELQRGRSGEA